ncbi:MAG: SDR family oxidoreductase [Propionibacteriaceae bacterium]|nr:SDR family oxidoreductase [Propionibacteriaceae bacterium]
MSMFSGKRFVVAGSATGIGAATARRLGAGGASVMLGDINIDGANTVAQQIVRAGGTATSGQFDMTDPVSIDALIEAAVDEFDGLDGIANIAADMSPDNIGRDVGLVDLDMAVWDHTLRVNLTGTALLCKAAIPHLIKAGGGSIVNTSSGAASVGEPVRVAYAVAKSGINALTRHIASAYGPQGVRANAVAPGMVLTEAGRKNMPPETLDALTEATPLQRLGRPDDIAQAICYLLSDDPSWVTGQVWHVNGGSGYRD